MGRMATFFIKLKIKLETKIQQTFILFILSILFEFLFNPCPMKFILKRVSSPLPDL